MYSEEEIVEVLNRVCDGQSLNAIARETGIPRRTIQRWLNGKLPSRQQPVMGAELVGPLQQPSYSYLLGLYLGDSHIVHEHRGVYRLTLYCDAKYTGIIQGAADAIQAVLPQNKVNVGRWREDSGALLVICTSKLWPVLFPQHGPGRKHERPIRLEEWQRVITHRQPHELIRGLIHSDGCRIVARQPGRGVVYLYPRYWFDNKSRDIIEIFCEHLALIGVEWTQPRPDGIQIARRDSVELLDSFIGPKW